MTDVRKDFQKVKQFGINMYVNFVEVRKMKKVMLMLFVVCLVAVSQAVAFNSINIDFQANGQVTYVGTAVAPDSGTVWNAPLYNATQTHGLLDSQGNVTNVSIWEGTNPSKWQYANANALMKDYAYTSTTYASGTTNRFTIFSAASNSGFKLDGTKVFDIYVYTMGDAANQQATFQLNHAGGTTVQAATGNGPFNGTFTEGSNYLKFSNVTAKSYGSGYEFEFFWGKTAGTNFGAINGIQLFEVPEPATMVLLGLGALVLYRRK